MGQNEEVGATEAEQGKDSMRSQILQFVNQGRASATSKKVACVLTASYSKEAVVLVSMYDRILQKHILHLMETAPVHNVETYVRVQQCESYEGKWKESRFVSIGKDIQRVLGIQVIPGTG